MNAPKSFSHQFLVDEAQKTRYEQLELKAPTLSQAEQFYEKQTSSTSLAVMRLLICWSRIRGKACFSRWILSTSENARSFARFFDLEALTAWQETAADVTFYFRWMKRQGKATAPV
ncbi:hypothetical protein [Klebsiella pneumoniae]|uniref:hypothetical protein n=1 Tax=Klebsiella pneumoniae TaxID=573 RepID=UPI003557B79B